ncbi:MAG: DUF2269 family protein, partial [Candidatus Limnocylindria bacterium]
MDVYPWLKALHILFAVVAVGFNISYGIWLVRATREPQHIGFALRGIKFMDDRVANPAYIGLLVVGVILVLAGGWGFTTLWVLASLILYSVLIVVGLGLYSPTLSRQIAVYEAEGPEAPEFAALSARGRVLGIILGVLVVVIILLMVT